MGRLEREARTEARRRQRWGKVQYALLATVGISGLLLVSMAAPNMLKLLRYIPKNKYRFNNQAKSALSKAADRGFVKFVEVKGKKHAELTDTGRRELMYLRQKFEGLGGKRRRWDKRWRVIIFDIPESLPGIRDSLRTTMKSFGFCRLQDSVWMYPYDCEDVMALLKTDLQVGVAVRYMIVEKIEHDKEFREHFGLS